jgi:hypothetical protein
MFLYSSPNTIRKIKSRRTRRAVHVTNMGKKRNTFRVLVGRPKGKNQLEDLGYLR